MVSTRALGVLFLAWHLRRRLIDSTSLLRRQVMKGGELREFARHEKHQEPQFGRRANKHTLEAKWRLKVGRAALCEGCGVRTIAAAAGSSGAKAWKCGPCVRAMEQAYISALEKQERDYQLHQEEALAVGVTNSKFREEIQLNLHEIHKLHLLLKDSETQSLTTNSYIEQLMSHVQEQKLKHERMVQLQNQIMSENGRLHGSLQVASENLERTGHISRDLEFANQTVRDENQQLQDRIQQLLETVGALREELRGSFKSSQDAQENMSLERREWQAAMRTLQSENEDLRRRLHWLEKAQVDKSAKLSNLMAKTQIK